MKKIAVVYWSGTGNTEKMAQEVRNGITDQGMETDLLSVSEISLKGEWSYQAFALGCPAMGNEVLEESEMEPFIEHMERQDLQGVPLALFGSYDWGDGQWMRDWEERMKKTGAALIQTGLILRGTPDTKGIEQCRELGKRLVAATAEPM